MILPDEGADMRFHPDAFKNLPKTLPLVVYEKDGTRRVVGDATLSVDETGLNIAGRVTDPKVGDILGFSSGLDDISVIQKEEPNGR